MLLGSAADVCELLAGDEIVSVNGARVASHYLESVQLVLQQASRTGQVELVVKRSISHGTHPQLLACLYAQ